MVRMNWSWVPVFLLIATSAAPVMGEPGPTCALLGDPLLVTQNDADSGQDAPDAYDHSLVLPEQDTIMGALQLPTGAGDPSDWYGLRVGEEHKTVMVELKPYSHDDLMDWGDLFVVDVVPPGTDTPIATVPMEGGLVSFTAQPGLWNFGVRFADTFDKACADSGGLVKLDPAFTTYYLYIGCDPVCAEGL